MKTKTILSGKIEIFKTFLSSIVMFMAVYSIRYYFLVNISSKIALVFGTLITIFIGVLVYCAVNMVLKNEDFVSLINIFKLKLKKNKLY